MRTRDLKPGFFQNEDLAAVPFAARLLYAGLWCIADRRGRLEDRPLRIKGLIFPYERVPVENHLQTLAERGFILRYEANGQKCIWIRAFLKHQHPHPNETESVLPPCNEEERPCNEPSLHGDTRTGLLSVPSDLSVPSEPSSDLELGLVVAAIAAPPKRQPASRKRELTEAEIAKTKNLFPLVDAAYELAQFWDYYAANKPRWIDFPAAYRKWMRKADHDRKARPNDAGNRRLPPTSRFAGPGAGSELRPSEIAEQRISAIASP